MTTAVAGSHIDVDADGTARIGATRYKVIHLAAEHFHYGWTAEELLRQHPDLRPEEVYSALAYFYDHRDEMLAEMHSTAAQVAAARDAQPLTREALLARRSESP